VPNLKNKIMVPNSSKIIQLYLERPKEGIDIEMRREHPIFDLK